jgi:hypothetical protein
MKYDEIYINGVKFPFTPTHDAAQEDVDLDAYTNLAGYTIRNRVRHDVKTLDFNIPVMSGYELHQLLAMRDPVWFQCSFFDEVAWGMVTKKMYCSTPKYKKSYIDANEPNNNIYEDVQFSFIEE